VQKRYEENTSLGNWVAKQREEYKKYRKGGKGAMTEERIAKLEKVGFTWSLVAKRTPCLSWDGRYVSFFGARTDNQSSTHTCIIL